MTQNARRIGLLASDAAGVCIYIKPGAGIVGCLAFADACRDCGGYLAWRRAQWLLHEPRGCRPGCLLATILVYRLFMANG